MKAETSRWPEGLRLRQDLRPGDLGRVIALHGEVYQHRPDFGLEFEAFVARTIAEYERENDCNGRIWLLERDANSPQLVGWCAIAFRPGGWAQLRWVLLRAELCGGGLVKRLIETGLQHCRESGVERVYLETIDSLKASSALYRKPGFREISMTTQLDAFRRFPGQIV